MSTAKMRSVSQRAWSRRLASKDFARSAVFSVIDSFGRLSMEYSAFIVLNQTPKNPTAVHGRFAFDHPFNNGTAAGVVAGMASRFGDPTLEQKPTIAAVQKYK